MKYKPLIISLYEIGAVKFGDFTLKSGQQSKIYLDLRQIISYPDVLRAVSEAIWQQMNGYRCDVICGVPYTAVPIATCISLQQNLPMLMRRKEIKEHGTKQRIEGCFQTGQQCIVIEDIVTTGGSVLETANDLEVAGLKVKEIAVLIDREQNAKENLLKQHYSLHAAFSIKELLNVLAHEPLVKEADRHLINDLLREKA